MLCIARAYYEAGEDSLNESKRVLQQALRISPDDVSAWYNLALVLHEMVVNVVRNPKRYALDIKRLESALDNLHQAKK